ncbi:MAG: GNAT family N-acetyltransferase [Chloroflexota bacterium]
MESLIRPMTRADMPKLAAWMVEAPLWKRYDLTIEKVVANFEGGLSRADWLLVAESDLQAVGFAWAIPKGAFGRSPYLRLIGVHPDKAGAGIGAKLLDEIERMALPISHDLFLLVSDFNQGAQRFYLRQGYEQIGAVPGYVIPDVTELIFRKRLLG